MPIDIMDDEAMVSFAIKAVLPEWQKKLYSKHSNEIQVHSNGELFYKINRLFPNEHPDSKAHRLLSFEPITKASYWKGITNIIEIFQNSSYTAAASQATIDLISQHNWEDKNFFSYFLEQWTHYQLGDDPNALCAIYPFEYLDDYPEAKQCCFVHSDYIRHNSDGVFVFISLEESDKTYSLQDIKMDTEQFYDPSINRENLRITAERTYSQKLVATITRPVIHVFNKNGFYRIEKDKEGAKYSWEFYPNKTEFVACQSIGGVHGQHPLVKKSFFEVAVPMANLALLQHSQHTAVNATFSFPRMSELEVECDFDGCNFGFVACDISDAFPTGRMKCPKCSGMGTTSNQSPYKIYKRKLDTTGMGDGNKSVDVDDVKFYSPDVAILEYSKEEWKSYLEEMEKALFITQQVKTGDVVAAKSKELDLKEKYSFLKRISKVFYPKLRYAIQCLENYLTAAPNEVSVTTPFSFAIITEAEALETLNNILGSTAPVLVKANEVDLYVSKFISQNSPVRKAFDVLKIVDKLLFYPIDDITIFKSNAVATREQWIIHVFAYQTLMDMYGKKNDLFKEVDANKIAEKLLAELEPLMQAPDTSLKAAIIKKSAGQ